MGGTRERSCSKRSSSGAKDVSLFWARHLVRTAVLGHVVVAVTVALREVQEKQGNGARSYFSKASHCWPTGMIDKYDILWNVELAYVYSSDPEVWAYMSIKSPYRVSNS